MDTEIRTPEGVIHLWFDETYSEQLNAGLSKKEIESTRVKREIQNLYPNAVLEHEENGAPLLIKANYSYISISHYRGWYALYFSNKTNGVDIQAFKNTLFKGKDYFINSKDDELELTATNLHLIWSAKEAFYKKHQGNIADLKNEVSVKEIDLKSKLIYLEYKDLVEVLCFRIYADFVLVWT